ncbi:MAG: bifunctional oligoribonuclease/PAP phosphatase NrnA [Patescibacteria group bacterium]|jgi:phosphoesterase RecJ-like protein
MNKEIYSQILTKIKSSQNILITTHENPDGDAVGSMCVMAELAVVLNKEFHIFCHDKPEAAFLFLPRTDKINSDKDKIDFSGIDLVLVVDCARMERSMIAEEIKKNNLFIINIDHHISNNNFGDINLVDGEAASTTQIIYEFLKYNKIEVNQKMANCILTGIMTDTGNFSYATTNSQTFSVASEMLIEGANARSILNYTSKNKNLKTLKAWGFALSRLRHNKEYDIVYTILTGRDLDDLGVSKQDLEGLASFLNVLKDAKIVMVLYELGDGRVKGSFRTNKDDIDVSKLAQIFGGGGHKKAAGFEVGGKLEQVKDGWKII